MHDFGVNLYQDMMIFNIFVKELSWDPMREYRVMGEILCDVMVKS